MIHLTDNQKARFRYRPPHHCYEWLTELGQVIPHPCHLGSSASESTGASMHEVSTLTHTIHPGSTLPRRCSIECRLTRGDVWSCHIFLRRHPASGTANVSELSKEPFGDDIMDKGLVEDLVSRAQLAILNPSKPPESFLEGDAIVGAPTEVSFSPDIVCLEITGPEYTDISFIDLPGTPPKF